MFSLSLFVSCSSSTKTEKKTGVTQLKAPEYDSQVLENGIKVYFLPDKTLPYFTVQAVLDKGAAQDFKDRPGLAYLMVSMLKEGSGDLNSEQYKAAYSKYSSEFNANVDKDLTHFKSTGLSKYSSEIIKLFVNTIFKPSFVQANKATDAIRNYDKIREKRVAQINKTFEDTSYFASAAFRAQIFHKQVYGLPELGTLTGIKKILLGDVQKYYKDNVLPENLQFALSGSFSPETKALFLKELNAIPKSMAKKPEVKMEVATQTFTKPQIIVVDKPNLKQAEVRIGHIGPKRADQNFIPLYIANSVVGSGDFSSQLMQEIRVKRGLVYGVNSGFYGFKDAGAFMLSGSTRHEKIPEFIQTALDILKSIKSEGLKAESLNLQKSILAGQFPLKFETSENYLEQQMRYAVYGFDKDYIKNFYNKIQNIELTEASEVLKKYYLPENSLIVIFASKNQIPNDLKKLNYEIKYIDYRNVF